jgi:hypothetical protein
MQKMRLNPPSYDLLVVLRATLCKLQARRKPLSSKQEIVKHALELRIRSIEQILGMISPGENDKKTVLSAIPERLPDHQRAASSL